MCNCGVCKRIRQMRTPWLNMGSPGAEEIWTPEGTAQGQTIALADRDDGSHIDIYQFVYEYRGSRGDIKVVRHSGTSVRQVEDMIGAATERFRGQVDRIRDSDNGDPALSAAQKKQVGPVIRDIKHHKERKKDLTRNMLFFPGAH